MFGSLTLQSIYRHRSLLLLPVRWCTILSRNSFSSLQNSSLRLHKTFFQYHHGSDSYNLQSRFFSRTESSSELLCERLDHRSLVKLTGHDTYSFLQGLITNDIHHLENSTDLTALYSMILNVQGRVLYDVILYKVESSEPTVLLECNSDIVSQLIYSLEKYKLRKKVKINDEGDRLKVSALFRHHLNSSSDLPSLNLHNKSLVYVHTHDPRLKTFGYRVVAPSTVKVDEVVDNCQKVSAIYDMCRYEIGLSEGTIDLPPGHCLPLESNLVFLNGVAFDKGCYIGQELTARTHHTGVIRKRLMPIIISSFSDKDVVKANTTVENMSGKVCGKVRNVIGKNGLALLRLEEVLGKPELLIKDGDEVVAEARTFVPSWWNIEMDEVLKQIVIKRQQAATDDQ